MLFLLYGVPGEAALGPGGESFSDVYAGEFNLVGTRPNYEPEGSRAFLD